MLQLLHFAETTLEVHNFNADFLLLRSAKPGELGKIGQAIFQRDFPFIDEVIVTEVEICLKLNYHFTPEAIDQLQALKVGKALKPQHFNLPVWFTDHPDWQLVTAATGLSRKALIKRLLNTEFSLAMFGFLPGFAYLSGLDTSLHIARKTVPAKYVAANSLALGGQYLGVYSLASPGGWYVLGQLPFSLLQVPEIPPVALHPGDRVSLKSITEADWRQISSRSTSLTAYNGR